MKHSCLDSNFKDLAEQVEEERFFPEGKVLGHVVTIDGHIQNKTRPCKVCLQMFGSNDINHQDKNIIKE